MANPNSTSISITEKDINRFWSKVDIAPNDKCRFLWNAATFGIQGYGAFSLNGKNHCAHRIAYLIQYGIDPGKLLVCHHCDNKKCVFGPHLFLGTIQDNTADMVAKGRQAKGDRSGSRLHPETVRRGAEHYSNLRPETVRRGAECGQAKLTSIQVLHIRAQYKSIRGQLTLLAKEFCVLPAAISDIVKRITWKHI